MASPVTHPRLKLWIRIVIIVAGSVLLVSLVIAGCWWCARRHRSRREPLPSPMLAPTRKVTIRRGRMVSSSRYLSLTGSRFGLGQFMNLEEKDQGEKGRSRSKSPFTWWSSNIQDRSQSRQSQMSSQAQMDEVQSRYSYQKPKPPFYNRHVHKQSAASGYSLPSIINGKELAEDARGNDLEAGQRLSANPHSPRYVNFSRAFSPHHESTLTSRSAPNILSQIVESSPRHSTVSKQTSFISTRELVVAPAAAAEDNDISTSTLPQYLTPPVYPPLHTSRSVPDELLRRSSGQNMTTTSTSRFSFATETSLSFSLSTLDQVVSRTPSQHLPTSPRSGPLPPSQPRPPRTHLDLSKTPPSQNGSSTNVYNGSRAPVSGKQPSIETFGELTVVDKPSSGSSRGRKARRRQSTGYGEAQPDPQPVVVTRKPSKKGNVLRKKSLKRAEIVSWVGN